MEYKYDSDRIGYPLAEELAKVYPNFTGNRKKTTTFKVHEYDYFDLDTIKELISDLQPDWIITHYHSVIKNLNSVGITNVSTIHSYQG